jgi:hypothetical protein
MTAAVDPMTAAMLTAERFAALPPRARGYVVYMAGARDDQLNVPDENNPYPAGSTDAQEWDAGAMSAYLEVLDGEE